MDLVNTVKDEPKPVKDERTGRESDGYRTV
jgi:hypothetical protein